MKLAGDGGTIAVVVLVAVVALSGCAGWGADGPAEEAIADENGPETTPEEGEDRNEEGDDSTGEDGSNESDEPSETDPPSTDETIGADEETETAETDGTDDVDETDGTEPSDAEEDDADEALDPADDDADDTDDGTGADANDGTDASEEDDGEESDETDGDDESDDPVQEYDAHEFTFVEIAYEDAEERPPNSVELLNTHDRSIDLSGWAITTTEGGEYVFPENAEVGSDDAIAVQFEPDELTRDGGTLALIDAQGNVVVEDEYGD